MKHTRRTRALRTLALLLVFGVCGASGLGAAATVQVQIKLTPNIPIPGYGFGWSSAVGETRRAAGGVGVAPPVGPAEPREMEPLQGLSRGR